jgi:hypothetical protein
MTIKTIETFCIIPSCGLLACLCRAVAPHPVAAKPLLPGALHLVPAAPGAKALFFVTGHAVPVLEKKMGGAGLVRGAQPPEGVDPAKERSD